MHVLRSPTHARHLGGHVPPAPDLRGTRPSRSEVLLRWEAPDSPALMLPAVRTCADIPWAMIAIDTWPDGEAKFDGQALLNQCWHELRCFDRPVPFGCDQLPYPEVPSHIDWTA